jgi:hypothetical protein
MKITKNWLEEKNACIEGICWFVSEKLEGAEGVSLVKTTMQKDLQWANWLVARLMTHKQQIDYAIYAAEQVIGIFEAKYPDDKRPRQAIDAAKAYLKNPTEKNKVAAHVAYAAHAAYEAACAAYDAAHDAADAAACAAYDAAGAAAHAAYAAYEAACAAYDAACAAAHAAAKLKQIIKYGITLLDKKEGGEGETNKRGMVRRRKKGYWERKNIIGGT